MQPAHHGVEVGQARRKPRQPTIALIRLGRHLDRLGRGIAERHEARAVLALVGQVEQPLLGLLDLRLRRRLDRRIVGHVHQVPADDDQLAPHGQIVDHPPIGRRVDDGRRRSRQPAEILRHRQLANRRLRIEERLQRHRRGVLAHADQLAHDLEQLGVQRLEEMRRPAESRNAVERFVVDEDRAKQSLLGFDVVRGLPEGQGVQAFFKRRLGGEGGKCAGVSHDRDLEPISSDSPNKPKVAIAGACTGE